jgi:hypothetical protein
MPLNVVSVQDSAELLAVLQAADISVPGRVAGRTTSHTEMWTIARLLSTLAKADRLAFPLSVAHRDRPDVLIQSDHSKIGVEITEAISQQFAAYSALAEREFPSVFLEPGKFRWGAQSLTVAQMRELLRQGRPTSDGWAGDSAEREWALFIQSVVDTKLAKLARPDFGKFEQNWLAVYDNLPLPNVHLADAISLLRPLLADRWRREPGFDVLFVEHGPVIARITESESEHLLLNDVWESGS